MKVLLEREAYLERLDKKETEVLMASHSEDPVELMDFLVHLDPQGH